MSPTRELNIRREDFEERVNSENESGIELVTKLVMMQYITRYQRRIRGPLMRFGVNVLARSRSEDELSAKDALARTE